MLKRLKSVSMLLFLMGASTGAAYAVANPGVTDVKITQQSGTCTGIVKDATGETVIGASVVVKGTTNGTITGIDGDFSLSNVKKGDIIQISFVGYQTVEIPWDGQPMNVTLQDDTQTLGEVVVTALGIKREKKALGYAMQEVKGDALLEARETNLANALTGKVSGVQIIRSSNGPGGSSKIQLRGANSVTGLNQPLIVVDGVPMDNFTGASNNDIDNPTLDMGNGLSDINAEDIESMSVLKGASAAALYGSRAGMPVADKWTQAFFNATCPRTAGFSSVDLASLSVQTLLVYLFLMWVGGGSQSTAGGVKVNAFAVVVLNLVAVLRGTERVEVFGRELSYDSIRRSNATVVMSLGVLFIFIFTLSILEPGVSIMALTFECVSALSTVGSSLNLTPHLCDASKLLVSLLMFIGRVGLITLMLGIVKQKKNTKYRYPSDNIIIN